MGLMASRALTRHAPRGRAEGTASPRPADQVDISPAAQAASEASQVDGEVRADLVARLRSEIADGSYDTTEKLTQAVDQLFDSIG